MTRTLKSIFEELPLGVLITTGDAEDPLVIYQNKKFTENSGFQPEDMLGKNPKIMQCPLTDRKVVVQLKDALRRRSTFIGGTFNYRKSGQAYPFCWTVFPVKLMGENVFVALREDLSDFDGDQVKKLMLIEKSACLVSVEMLNRIQMAAQLMTSSSKLELDELALVIQSAVEMIKELENIVKHSISLMIKEKEAIEASGDVAPSL